MAVKYPVLLIYDVSKESALFELKFWINIKVVFCEFSI